jgi:uncharacterized protein (TIGR00251 family)
MDDPAKQLEQMKNTLSSHGEINLEVKAVPGSSYTGISGFLGTALKVKITSPPEKGKANDEIIKVLADTFKVPSSCIQITKGATSPRKKFHITTTKNGL